MSQLRGRKRNLPFSAMGITLPLTVPQEYFPNKYTRFSVPNVQVTGGNHSPVSSVQDDIASSSRDLHDSLVDLSLIHI